MNDLDLLLLLGPLVLILAIACEVAWRNRYVPQWLARKVLHIAAVGSCALVPLWLGDLALLRWIVAGSEIVLIWLVVSGRLFDQDGARSWGIVLFPLIYLFLLSIEEDRWLITLPMAVLALSDALTAVAGILLSSRFFRFTSDPKSAIGSSTFFIVTIVVILLFPEARSIIFSVPLWASAVLLIVIALLLTAIEALASRGTDNLFIPLAAWLLIKHLSFASLHSSFVIGLGITCALAFVFIAIGMRMRWLTLGGAIAASLIGLWVMYFAGPLWLIPLFVFLIGSTLIGRSGRSMASDPKHGKPRDAIQVICNGGVFAAAASIPDPQLAHFAMGASIAVSAADTWASEIGMAFRGRTIDIASGRLIPPGLSGGISLAGSAGALLASVLFGAIGMLLIDRDRWILLLFIAIAGMSGMLLDSLLGSKLQPRFQANDGSLSDVRHSGSKQISGVRWMTNDAVNIISNLIITVLSLLLFDRFAG